jgi:hypothetical protein
MDCDSGGSVNRGSPFMNTFYQVLPYALIFVQALWSATIARRYAFTQSSKSKLAVTLFAVLPIPVLLAGFAVFAFIVVGRSNLGDREAFITLILGALFLLAFGLFNAFLGYRLGKASLRRRQSQ